MWFEDKSKFENLNKSIMQVVNGETPEEPKTQEEPEVTNEPPQSEGAEVLKEAKKSDYQLYHKDFSSAMQHAYDVAKKRGYKVDPNEIDRKVAMGPKKPSSAKTNRYILGTNDKNKRLHV